MKYQLTNINMSGVYDLVTVSATVEILSDDDELIHSDSISHRQRPSASAGWYIIAKASLLAQAQEIVDKFLATFGPVLVETGKSNITEIIDDIKTHVEGGLS